MTARVRLQNLGDAKVFFKKNIWITTIKLNFNYLSIINVLST